MIHDRHALVSTAVWMAVEVVLLAILATLAHLGPTGWVVGVVGALVANLALWRGLRRASEPWPTPADRVTLLRAAFVMAVTALVADSFVAPVARTALVVVAAIALLLDAVDGKVARGTHRVTTLGARFDMEIDAWLILVLSIYAVRFVGAWVLAIGLARYALLVAGWLWPWLRAPAPPRYWNKVVAALQGIVLVIAASEVLPRPAIEAVLIVAAALLAESFLHQVAWLWNHRAAAHPVPTAPARIRWWSAAITVLAGVLVWIALVAPNLVRFLIPDAFLPIPVTFIAVLALACVLPARVRRPLAPVLGFLIGLLVLVKMLDMGFFEAFDRPVDLVTDWFYFSPGVGVLVDTYGRTAAYLIVAGAALLVAAILVVTTWATARLMRGVASVPKRWSWRIVGAFGALWAVFLVTNVVTPVLGWSVASDGAIVLARARLGSIPGTIVDDRRFKREIADDPLRSIPEDHLLTALKGKDVLLIFIESYGRVAVQGTSFSPGVDRVLEAGTRALAAHGYESRSAFMVSPTFGGGSWLAHSTMESGLWVDNQSRYSELLASHRMTLASTFKRAGWRTVSVVPADTKPWPQGKAFYGFDALYNDHNLGYKGPRFSYATMPDQFTLAAFKHLELDRPDRPPLFAEIDFVSSHDPWMPLPHMVPWSELGDGSIFGPQAAAGPTPAVGWKNPATVKAMYGESVQYSMSALFSFLTKWPDPNLVLIVLGDHQPWQAVSGNDPGHEVPAAIIAHDPAVIARIADWHWQPGMLPRTGAPVWKMSAFRDRFVTAFSRDAAVVESDAGGSPAAGSRAP